MYYEEKWIEGRLCYRHIPNGGWTEFDISMYRQALDDLRHQVKKCDLADVVGQSEQLVCVKCGNKNLIGTTIGYWCKVCQPDEM